MVTEVIKELKREKEELQRNKKTLDNTLENIENRGELKISENEYSNGLFLTGREYGYDDILQTLKYISKNMGKRIEVIEYALAGLEEE